nr:TIGR00266 family protein [uncultured Ilyobacter sp.]
MMADVIDYKIYGHDMQLVEIELDPGEGVRAEAGAMTYMESQIEMQTGTGGGLFGGFKRMITGESFFITTFKNNGKSKKSVGFSAPYPGQIIPLDLNKFNGEFICQKDSFLCAANGIDIDVAFTKKLGAGFFGGEGFILQRLKGDGMTFVHAGGSIIEKDLKAGETLRVDTGCIVGFERSVDYDIRFVGGFKNALFGKEGLFLATLKGPGRVYIQSMPISKLAERLYANMGSSKERGGSGGTLLSGAVAGGILGGILDRD